MGEVIQFVPKAPAIVPADELAEIIAWIKPAKNWRIGQMQIALAYHHYMTADYRRILASDAHGKDSAAAKEHAELSRRAFRVWNVECLKQVFIPAACVRHLRWKEDWLKRHGGGTPETALAIDRDKDALAGRLRPFAGRAKVALS
ncbi:MAG: hypothetical protein EOR60_15390 [Mesorhizobium sp.]|nr:MAG: hypothetical protein EOR60_15390 [Mesorhizobium sp.]